MGELDVKQGTKSEGQVCEKEKWLIQILKTAWVGDTQPQPEWAVMTRSQSHGITSGQRYSQAKISTLS